MSRFGYFYSLFIAFCLGYSVSADYPALAPYDRIAWWYFVLAHSAWLGVLVIYYRAWRKQSSHGNTRALSPGSSETLHNSLNRYFSTHLPL